MSDTDTTTTDVDETTTDADTTTEADAGQGDAGKPWTPPSEAEYKALQAKLKKANGEAAAHRKQADELKRKGETDAEAAVRTAREEAAAEAEKAWKPRYVRTAARAALAEAGLIGPPDRLLRLIDTDAVDVDDDDDTMSGLDDQIRALRKDYPELFARKGSARVDGSDRSDSGGRRDALSSATRRLLEQVRS